MTSTTDTDTAPVPARKAKEQRPCGCGCGGLTTRTYRQGHDMRIPLGASCSRCRKTATIAAGRVPACDSHIAAVVRDEANGRDRVSVRVLPAKPTAAKAA